MPERVGEVIWQKVRVSTLAKEFGMTSKELMGHLADMKIPVKSASSALEDAYVAMVRKQLAPVIEARAQEVEAAKQAEEQAAAAEEAARAAEAERERIAAEKAREEERRQFAAAQAAEEAARAEAEAKKKAEQERLAREKEEAAREAQRRAVPLLTPGRVSARCSTRSPRRRPCSRRRRTPRTRPRPSAPPSAVTVAAITIVVVVVVMTAMPPITIPSATPLRAVRIAIAPTPATMSLPAWTSPTPISRARAKKRKGGHNNEEDHYSRMAREAEEYSREKVLEEARAAVEEASRESTGRRKKRKEKREREAAKAQEERKIEEALAQGVNPEELDAIKVSQGVTVQELAEALDVPANDIIKRLFLLGTPLTMTQSMSDDLVELVADDLGRQIKIITPEEENTFSFYDDPADLKPRAPVVTVMGHVDHGKTSLLDAIRHTGVAAGEAGGITQAIGASQVMINDRKITFIDTPGHATFTAMRARGAKVTDIVILIVAADDGVMPQTIESINHAKAAGVPIVVAVNKIDKPGANPDRVRQELTEYGIIPEEWGGQNMFVNISAKQKIGIDDLLETVLLQADVLELKANPDTFASGNVLEAKLDKGRGSVATVLVTRGTLHVGDTLVAGLTYGRVRAMLDPKGNAVTEAGPSDAVEILGLQSVPNAGDEFRVFEDEREARALADERSLKARIEEQSRVKHVTLENLFETIADAEVKELNLIIKADVQGSIEALQDSLDKMDQSEVRINTIHSAVGAINETDVVLADASNAIIIGFGVRPDSKARSAAEREGVEIRCYDVIYKCLEELDAARIGMLKPTEVEGLHGYRDRPGHFKVPKVGIAAGVPRRGARSPRPIPCAWCATASWSSTARSPRCATTG